MKPRSRIGLALAGGLPVVLSQTFRSLIHSRLELGLKGYAGSHPGTDIVLLEPDHRDLARPYGVNWPGNHHNNAAVIRA